MSDLEIFGGSEAIEVVTGELREASGTLGRAGAILEEVYRDLRLAAQAGERGTLGAGTGAWAASPSGPGGSAPYAVSFGDALGLAGRSAEGIRGLASALETAAQNYERAERQAMEHPGGYMGPSGQGAPGSVFSLKQGFEEHRPPGIEGTVSGVESAVQTLNVFRLGPSLDPASPAQWSSGPDGDRDGDAGALVKALGLAGMVFDSAGAVVIGDADLAVDAPATASGFEDLVALEHLASQDKGALLVTRTESGAWIVTVPGTNTQAGTAFGTDRLAAAMVGDSRDVGLSTVAALRAAGAADGDAVILNGHSQGGRHAVNLALDPELKRNFRVGGVVTAGAPVGRAELPEDVWAVHLEHVDDSVPGLDGVVPVPLSRRRVLVRGSEFAPTFRERHEAKGNDSNFGPVHSGLNYAQLGRQADRSSDPRLKEAAKGMGLGGRAVTLRFETHQAGARATVTGSDGVTRKFRPKTSESHRNLSSSD